MSKLLKKDLLPEDNSFHVSQMKAQIDSLIATHTTAMEAHLMIGSANAAWVPAPLKSWFPTTPAFNGGAFGYRNEGAQDYNLVITCPKPTNRGGLKLYIANFYVGVGDADAGDYINQMRIIGLNDSSNILYTDGTNIDAPEAKTYAFVDIDCSSYKEIVVELECVVTNANDLDKYAIAFDCYYDT